MPTSHFFLGLVISYPWYCQGVMLSGLPLNVWLLVPMAKLRTSTLTRCYRYQYFSSTVSVRITWRVFKNMKSEFRPMGQSLLAFSKIFPRHLYCHKLCLWMHISQLPICLWANCLSTYCIVIFNMNPRISTKEHVGYSLHFTLHARSLCCWWRGPWKLAVGC